MENTEKKLRKELQNAFSKYLEEGNFFEYWFRKSGHPYFLTFKKNVSVTNIQYGELVALLREFTSPEIKENKFSGKALQILSVKQLNSAIVNIFQTFKDSTKNDKKLRSEIITALTENYFDLLSNTIVIDYFQGSCALFYPPSLNLDLKSLIAYSGYINSGGDLIYLRNVSKAKCEELSNDLESYLNFCEDKSMQNFEIYCHEDFMEKPLHNMQNMAQTKYKRQEEFKKALMKNGVDNLKIHLNKFYMYDKSLQEVLINLKEQFKDRLNIPNMFFSRDENSTSHQTIWLLMDKKMVDPSF